MCAAIGKLKIKVFVLKYEIGSTYAKGFIAKGETLQMYFFILLNLKIFFDENWRKIFSSVAIENLGKYSCEKTCWLAHLSSVVHFQIGAYHNSCFHQI